MQIGIIGGTGREGRGIATRLAPLGVRILIGSRTPERARDTARQLSGPPCHASAEGSTNDDAAGSDVVFLAVPFDQLEHVLGAHRDRFQPGALVVDVTVPLRFGDTGPEVVHVAAGSASELVRASVRADVHVVGTFKTIPASLLERLETPLDCDEFVCGSSGEARERAMELLGRIPSLRALDLGGLRAARDIEHLTALAVRLNKQYRVGGARYRVVGL